MSKRPKGIVVSLKAFFVIYGIRPYPVSFKQHGTIRPLLEVNMVKLEIRLLGMDYQGVRMAVNIGERMLHQITGASQGNEIVAIQSHVLEYGTPE
jgi:hypothetical protein